MGTRKFAGLMCVLVLASVGFAAAQVKQPLSPQPVRCAISIDSSKIDPNGSTSVLITIANVSVRNIEIETVASFKLLKRDPNAAARNFSLSSDSYWSPLDVLIGEPLRLATEPVMLKKGIIAGRVPRGAMRLAKGEVKTFRVALGKLLWNKSALSDWPHRQLSDVVEPGPYWLVLNLDSRGKLQSNRLEVTVE